MTMAAWAKQNLPPALATVLKRLSGRSLRFDGSPLDWADAVARSTGYDESAILERVREATRAVVDGRACYERDSALFYEPMTPLALLAGLLRSAAQDDGRLMVIDIGGSLGSSYRQCRPFLSALRQLAWHVVEQPKFVQAGRAEFATAELQFQGRVEDVPASTVPATFLISSALQYMRSPAEVLGACAARPARHLLIFRTPMSAAADHRLCIQHAPRKVYAASYPCWVLSRARLLELLAPHWLLISEQAALDGAYKTSDGLAFEFRDLIFERRT